LALATVVRKELLILGLDEVRGQVPHILLAKLDGTSTSEAWLC
jgi:hypothetical protein